MNADRLKGAADSLEMRSAIAIAAMRTCYGVETKDSATGKQKIRQREGLIASSIQALESDLAAVLTSVIDTHRYKVMASAGQPGRPFVLIPYAMLLRKDVTTTPRRGIYIALLFQQDYKALWLTLNQGLQQFEDRFGLSKAGDFLKEAADIISASVPIPEGFITGSISLGATSPYGLAYEQGSIIGKRYALDNFDGEGARLLLRDLRNLLALYDALPRYAIQNPSIVIADSNANDGEVLFQKMANASAKKTGLLAVDIPIPRPKPITNSVEKLSWGRDAQVAGAVLQQAGYCCDASCGSQLFRAAVADHHYVEAHHLIPLAMQNHFGNSLDVPANIVSLCPACHAKVHRGHRSVRDPLILKLYDLRVKRLQSSGLVVSAGDLLAMY